MQFLVDMVPENIIGAASKNQNMLQIIFFAIIFEIAMVVIPGEKIQTVKNFVDGLNEVILKIIDFIMKFAPYGVFALLAALIVEFSGDVDLFVALANYAGTKLFQYQNKTRWFVEGTVSILAVFSQYQ